MPSATRNRWLGRAAVTVLVALALAEIALRVVMGNLSIMELIELHPGDGRCVGLRPGAVVPYTGFLWKIPAVDHDVNALGYRGPARPVAKPEGVLRVVVLGDSFAYGQAVRAGETIPAYLEKELAAREPTRTIEVLNFGVPGLNAEEYREQLEHFAARWRPDLVLVFLFENDLEPSMCALASGRTFWWYLRNVYVLRLVAFAARVYGDSRPEVSDPVERMHAAVIELAASIRRAGAEPAVVVLGDPIRHELRQDENAGSGDRLQGFFEEANVPWFDHPPDEWGAQIPGEGHFTPEANRETAALIAGWVRGELERTWK